jgi:hypothetical protein
VAREKGVGAEYLGKGHLGGGRLRKFLSALVVPVLIAASSPSLAQTVGGGATLSSEASASWLIRTIGDVAVFRFLHVGAYEDPSGGRDAIAVVGTSRCSVREDGRVIVASCRVVSRIAFLRPRDVRFDPLLKSARVVIKDGRTTHRAQWRDIEEENPEANYWLSGSERALVFGVAASRPARARGRVSNRAFSPKSPYAYAQLRRAAGVLVIHETDQQLGAPLRVRGRSRAAVLDRVAQVIASR